MNLRKLKAKYILEPYRKIASFYTQRHFDEKAFDQIIDHFSGLLKPRSNILNIGCGPGGETKKLLKHRFDVTSIDISPEMLSIARKKVPTGKFLEMDMTKLDFPPHSFAGIWCARSLIHIPSSEQPRVLSEMKRILVPEGIACIVVIEGERETLRKESYDHTGKTKTFFHYFSKSELENLLKSTGFTITSSQKVAMPKYKETYIVVIAKKSCPLPAQHLDKKC